jgi:hypothetical protein
LSHLYIKTNILPRQARDKHRENSKKDAVPSVTHVSQEDHTLQWCDFNVAPRVNLATTNFQGDDWTLVRRVKQGDTWHPATDELLGTDEYGEETRPFAPFIYI